jgi:hypothetical protein
VPNRPRGPGAGPAARLAAPTGLIARNGARSLVYLEWSNHSSRETGFELQRRQGDGAWQLPATMPATQTRYFDFALVPGTSYLHRVRAVGKGGPSAWSNEVSWTVSVSQ